MGSKVFDLLVIGGGINGTGVAADAAGRGLKVLLAEMGDLAGATSSASSKLIHGGLRYLEHYEFRLVREALAEREVLLARAPHLIWPLRFVLPHAEGMRSRLMIRAGLFLYDHLARRQRIPGSRAIDLRTDRAGLALRPDLSSGYSYWDCWVDDARLVVLNARLAADKGAEIRTRTRVSRLVPGEGAWTVNLEGPAGRDECRARVVVNAAGPWADKVSALKGNGAVSAGDVRLRLVKGSHIVVERIAGAEDAYLLQNADGRVVFVLPFEERFTLIGTTDVAFDGDPAGVSCSVEEEDYLLQAVNRFLARPLRRAEIVWRYAGVRPLQGREDESNPSAISRDYHLDVEGAGHGAAMLTITGGKVTTYRRLAEEVMARLEPEFPGMAGPWTAAASLPGGDMIGGDFEAFEDGLAALFPWLPADLRHGLARRHGSLVTEVLGDARSLEDLGGDIGGGLTAREVRHFAEREWATTADDILWRRTKAGLHLKSGEDREALARRIAALLP